MTEILDSDVRELPSLFENIRVDDGVLYTNYLPLVGHSEAFVNMTGDDNPIHRGNEHVIVPGFLHTCSGKVLVDYLFRELDSSINLSGFPYVRFRSKMTKLVVSGLEYNVCVRGQISADNLTASVKISRFDGSEVYTNEVDMRRDNGEHVDLEERVHVLDIDNNIFPSGLGVNDFSYIIGSETPQRRLHALASSFKVLFDSAKKVPSDILDGVVPVYDSQNISYDSDSNLNLKQGITLELHEKRLRNYGKKGGRANTDIFAKNSDREVLYRVTTPLSFSTDKFLNLALRRELRQYRSFIESQ